MVHRRRILLNVSVVAITLFAATSWAAAAETTKGNYEFQSYVGYYFPHNSDVDEDITWGTRAGRFLKDRRWNVLAGFEYFKPDGQFTQMYFFDVTGVLHFRPDTSAIPTVYAGLGYVVVDDDDRLGDDDLDLSEVLIDDSVFVSFGVGYKLFLNRNKTWNLNLRTEGRWYEGRDDSDLDRVFIAGLGWVMGR